MRRYKHENFINFTKFSPFVATVPDPYSSCDITSNLLSQFYETSFSPWFVDFLTIFTLCLYTYRTSVQCKLYILLPTNIIFLFFSFPQTGVVMMWCCFRLQKYNAVGVSGLSANWARCCVSEQPGKTALLIWFTISPVQEHCIMLCEVRFVPLKQERAVNLCQCFRC